MYCSLLDPESMNREKSWRAATKRPFFYAILQISDFRSQISDTVVSIQTRYFNYKYFVRYPKSVSVSEIGDLKSEI